MKQCTFMLVFAYAVATLLTVTPLAAGTLNADGVKKVLVGKIWAEKRLGGLFSESFWEWKADGRSSTQTARNRFLPFYRQRHSRI